MLEQMAAQLTEWQEELDREIVDAKTVEGLALLVVVQVLTVVLVDRINQAIEVEEAPSQAGTVEREAALNE